MDRLWKDPVLVVMIVQTVVYAATLLALSRQTWLQTRALRAAEYARCTSDYSALIRMMIEQPQLQTIYDDLAEIEPSEAAWLKYDSQQKLLYNYIELSFELFERVYYLWQKKWIDTKTWSQWEKWLQYLSKHPLFNDFRHHNKEMFSRAFEEYIDRLIKKNKSST